MTTRAARISDRPLWSTQPKQEVFLLDYAWVFEALFGGAAGGGKSDSLLAFSIARRLRFPGSSGLFLRREYQQLVKQGAAIPRSHELLTGYAAWNGSERKWTFKREPGQAQGSVLEFGHLHGEEDKHSFQTAAYADICFDELTNFTETQYLYLFSRARTTIPGCRPKVRGATNPGNTGHGWVKRRFIDPMPERAVRYFKRVDDRDTETDAHDHDGRSRVFVRSLVHDNRILLDANPEYIATLKSLPEADRKALLEGDWDAWAGQVFTDWNRDTHVLKPFAIPPTWTRRVGMDWGTARPFVALWIAWGDRLRSDPEPNRDCDGEHAYVYREVHEAGWRDEQMADAVVDYSMGERITSYLADPNSFFLDNNQTGYSPAALFLQKGIALRRANNDRILGKRRVAHWLARCDCGVPRLRVFESCVNLIAAIPSLPYDKHRVEDVDTHAEGDDPYDALRYALMGPRPAATSGTVTVRGVR